ncbi:hypothetical protein ACFQY7_25995 [Actinomadura luteofluorescens]
MLAIAKGSRSFAQPGSTPVTNTLVPPARQASSMGRIMRSGSSPQG